MKPFLALVSTDLKLFFQDRRAVLFTFAMPVVIASFFGAIMGGKSGKTQINGVPIVLVDQDLSSITREISTNLVEDANLQVTFTTEEQAREKVRAGKLPLAVIIPDGFGDAAGRALFGGGKKPVIQVIHDPSRNMEVSMIRGLLVQHVMEVVTREMFSGEQGRRAVRESLDAVAVAPNLKPEDQEALRNLLKSVDKWMERSSGGTAASVGNGNGPRRPVGSMTMPFDTKEEALTNQTKSDGEPQYNGYAHSIAGMGVQFVLMAAIEMGVGILHDRQRGLWRRLRSAPLARGVLLAAKATATTIIASLSLTFAFVFGMLVFGVRVEGSALGLLATIVSIAFLSATLGLMLAALGKTPNGTRGLAIPAVLILVMLGGAWIPSFIFPVWLQKATLITPTRWAVDGLDAMTWRGLGMGVAFTGVAVMLGYALLLGAIAWWRFKWEAD
ncbi:MAG TPA: ABC transporter permease [Verrucomicrobiae bacterium]|nr:ABC transporter permease [Verrucomicrobiae bacterium]